jgi:hypothetical protein
VVAALGGSVGIALGTLIGASNAGGGGAVPGSVAARLASEGFSAEGTTAGTFGPAGSATGVSPAGGATVGRSSCGGLVWGVPAGVTSAGVADGRGSGAG